MGNKHVALDAGTYTIYAVSQPNDAQDLQNAAYGTVSVIIKKPFVSATASQSTIAQGDDLYITGTAEGQPSAVQIWILGKNFAVLKSTSVNSDASFNYEVTSADTKTMATGQYFVVVQHPMQNNIFDIDLNTTAGTRQLWIVRTRISAPARVPTALFQLSRSRQPAGIRCSPGTRQWYRQR